MPRWSTISRRCSDHARQGRHHRARRPGRPPRRGRGRHRQRPALHHRGRARRHRRPPGARPHPGGVRQLRVRLARPPDHHLAAPADLPKQGSGFDLPIAIGLLAAAELVPPPALDGLWAIGELGLGGDLRPVRGVLASALAARRAGARTLLVPSANLAEAALVPGLRAAGASTLGEVSAWLRGTATLPPPGPARRAPAARVEDLSDVRGQALARRALEIAAAGGHNLLLVGPPGAGKTMLARRLVGLLPELGRDEALEVTQVLSAAGLLGADAGLVTARPFRAPHHTVSVAGLVGGGSRIPRPGEVSLAHARIIECHRNTCCHGNS